MSRINDLRDRATEWAKQNREDELMEGILCYLGAMPRSEYAVLTAISFSLLAPAGQGPSLIERYIEIAGRLPRAERLVAQNWQKTFFSILRVIAVERGSFVDVHDVLRDRVVRVYERTGTEQLNVGTWLAAFYFEEDKRTVFEGTLLVIPPQARIFAVQAALRAYAASGVDPRSSGPKESRAVARAALDGVHKGLRPPKLVNQDGHDIQLVTSTIGLSWEEVLAVVKRWEDASIEKDLIDIFGENPVAVPGGPAVRASFRREGDAVRLSTNSRARHEAVLARWQADVGSPLPVTSEEIRPSESDPEGPLVTIDSARVQAREAYRVEQEADAAWLDASVPALDGLSPREAARAGRRAELWAMLSEGERGEKLAEELGLAAR